MRAVALRSPAVMSMSISRPARSEETSDARRSRSSVSLPMALTTSTTWSPRFRVRATWSATARIRSASATDVPPNFCTTRPTPSTLPRYARGRPPTKFIARMATEKRQRQKEGHRLQKEELRKWEQRRRSRRRLLTWGAVIVVAVALLFGYSALQGDDEDESPTTTTTIAPATDTTAVTSTTAAIPTTTTAAP